MKISQIMVPHNSSHLCKNTSHRITTKLAINTKRLCYSLSSEISSAIERRVQYLSLLKRVISIDGRYKFLWVWRSNFWRNKFVNSCLRTLLLKVLSNHKSAVSSLIACRSIRTILSWARSLKLCLSMVFTTMMNLSLLMSIKEVIPESMSLEIKEENANIAQQISSQVKWIPCSLQMTTSNKLWNCQKSMTRQLQITSLRKVNQLPKTHH